MHLPFRHLLILVAVMSNLARVHGEDTEPISPTKSAIPLFNGKNLDGLYTWLQDSKYEDPRKVFTVEDGMLHISGDAGGYICTKQSYKDYRLIVEYRWGERTWQSRKNAAKDTGVIVHATDPDGSFQNVFMAGIEAQIIEGGTGDFLVLPGTRADGSSIPASLTAETTTDRDGEIVWKKGSPRKTFNTFQRINWYGRDPDWSDVLGFRGKQDVESAGTDWTRLEVICDGKHIACRVNDVLVNEAFDCTPSAGKILIQTELAEVFVRRFELHPLQ